MQPFPFYLQIGFEHISNLAGYDHILFLVALCAVYRLEQWRKIIILVTAFTLGHCVTLVLASTDVVSIRSDIIEFLIPVTILLTALQNVINHRAQPSQVQMRRIYFMALFFGFIHGMGFSNYFRALLMGDGSVLIPLLGFNIGIELGQLMIVAIILSIAFFFMRVLKVQYRDWNLFVSGAAAGMSLMLMAETKFW